MSAQQERPGTKGPEPLDRRESMEAGGFGGPKAARAYVVIAALVGVLGWLIAREAWNRPAPVRPEAFAAAVDTAPLSRMAVHTNGRLKSFDSFAEETSSWIYGPHTLGGQSDAFTYFDMMLRPERYAQADSVFVKSKALRAQMASRLEASGVEADRIDSFMRTGLIAPVMITGNELVRSLLSSLSRDAVRTAKHVEQIQTSLHLMRPQVLIDRLAIVPPSPPGGRERPWRSVSALGAGAPADAAHGGMTPPTDLDPVIANGIREAWTSLETSWRAEDAPAVNAALARLDGLVHSINAEVYPSRERLMWESRYFQAGNLTWTWIIYLFAIAAMLMRIVYRWKAAGWIGAGLFGVAFALQTGAFALRWWVSARFPNSNMFEAVTTAAWFGGLGAIALELWARRSAMRGLFLLGSAVASMTALMAANFLPLQLNPAIGNKMPVLHDVWLYIHTNVIIFSYCLIAMAAVTAGMYLIWRLGGGGMDYARAGGGGSLMRAESGGAARRVSAGEVFDGATMVLLEMSFVLLWAGIVMGAIWADHSWGRPWGWDPKEVFALNTFVIYAILLHTRLKAADKGLWTAWLALAGCAVMLFNWTVINFVITGLHSYA